MNNGPDNPHIGTGEVHIWYFRLDQWRTKTEELKSLLSPEEIIRGERYVIHDRERDFIVNKGLVRLLLSQYLNQKPEEIEFSTSETGKPFILDAELQYNISHSNELLLCAISADAPLGIDIQQIYEIKPLDRISKKILSPTEIQLIESIPSNEYLDHFFTIWAAKEAFLKASGEGFSRSPNQFSIYHIVEKKIILKYEGDQTNLAEKNWTIRPLRIDPNYKAVLVCTKEIDDIIIEHFPFPDQH